MNYTVLSPDGFTIACDAIYPTVADAQQALATWCQRYSMQGYYRDGRMNKIDLADLPGCCQIIAL